MPDHSSIAAAGSAADTLRDFLHRHHRLLVLTGAGCSTASGIPDYRGADGQWKRRPPVSWQHFAGDVQMRRRYWARSLQGFPAFAAARPNEAHRALARWQRHGQVLGLVTQNVDDLHQEAGSPDVLPLHGSLDTVVCTTCGGHRPRADLQAALAMLNPQWLVHDAPLAPDGDADLESADFSSFQVVDCAACGGMLRPDVVFFGENVPPARTRQVDRWLSAADALLVVGSSLQVFSGFRIVRNARARDLPVLVLNRGITRADALVTRLDADCAATLAAALPTPGCP